MASFKISVETFLMIKKLCLLLLSLGLFGCNSQSDAASKINSTETRPLSEPQKLANRKEKWNRDRKCLKAIEISSDKIDKLCVNSNDIYTLAEEGSLEYAQLLVENQLEVLNTYQEELDEGLRDKIPPDELQMSELYLKAIMDKRDSSLDIAREQENESYICAGKGYLGEVDTDFCIEDVEDKYNSRQEYIGEKIDSINTALKTYEENYSPMP